MGTEVLPCGGQIFRVNGEVVARNGTMQVVGGECFVLLCEQ
jgi:uncharacterized Zn-binding protein involved in type VI secretion